MVTPCLFPPGTVLYRVFNVANQTTHALYRSQLRYITHVVLCGIIESLMIILLAKPPHSILYFCVIYAIHYVFLEVMLYSSVRLVIFQAIIPVIQYMYHRLTI